MNRQQEMRDQCVAFHKANPHVWVLFQAFTFDRIRKGYENYSVNGIFERIRWEVGYGSGDGSFKLNNNYRPFYARRFMAMYPEHEGFFRTRKQISKSAAATCLPELKPRDYDLSHTNQGVSV